METKGRFVACIAVLFIVMLWISVALAPTTFFILLGGKILGLSSLTWFQTCLPLAWFAVALSGAITVYLITNAE